MKHGYNESLNSIDSWDIAFETKDYWHKRASDWHGEYGDSRSPSLYTRSLDAVNIKPN